jgi:anthranilate phosphoribosyltransferase
MKKLLQYLFAGNTLSQSEAQIALTDIASGNQNDAQVAAFLSVYNLRMPSTEELVGFRNAMLELATPVKFSHKNTLDIVGTGGDGKSTFNISTLACFVCAGAGIKVTKHGNYGVSSVSGSSNVLEYLGINFDCLEDKLNEQLENSCITFLHAPLFHPAMKNVANVRKQLQVKTIFNLLGPLVNPGEPQTQVIGVHSEAVGKLYKEVLKSTDVNFAIVHSLDGYDEISLTDDTRVHIRKRDYLITPHAFGLDKISPEEIYGGESIESNGLIFRNILEGKGTSAQNSVVLANAALAIAVHHKTDMEQGMEKANESLFSGNALRCFEKLKALCS